MYIIILILESHKILKYKSKKSSLLEDSEIHLKNI